MATTNNIKKIIIINNIISICTGGYQVLNGMYNNRMAEVK